MTKIDAIVREDVYEEIKEALDGLGVHGMTISQVMGCGIQGGYTSIVRGSRVDIQMLPKIKFEIVVSSQNGPTKWSKPFALFLELENQVMEKSLSTT